MARVAYSREEFLNIIKDSNKFIIKFIHPTKSKIVKIHTNQLYTASKFIEKIPNSQCLEISLHQYENQKLLDVKWVKMVQNSLGVYELKKVSGCIIPFFNKDSKNIYNQDIHVATYHSENKKDTTIMVIPNLPYYIRTPMDNIIIKEELLHHLIIATPPY